MSHAFSSVIPSPHRLPFIHSANDEAKEIRGGSGRDVILDPLTPGPTGVSLEVSTPGSGMQAREKERASYIEQGQVPDGLPLPPHRPISSPSTRRNRERISSIHGQSSSEGSSTEKNNSRLTLTGLRPRPRPRQGSRSDSGTSEEEQYVSIKERRRRQHDGDYVDSPLAAHSRSLSRLEARTPSPLGLEATTTPTETTAREIPRGSDHSRDRSISGPSRGERELVRRALADEHASASTGLKVEPLITSGLPGTSVSAPTSPTVPFPSSSSTRPRSHSRRSTRLSLDLDIDPTTTEKSSRPRSSRSRSRSGSGSTPHSPILPNGSVGIGPALGIVKASARLRAIVDHDQRSPRDSFSGPSTPSSPLSPSTSAMGSRLATPRSAPRRMLTDQTGSRSSTPGSSRSNSIKEGQGNRRRTKSLMSPGATGIESDPTIRRVGPAMLGERRRSTTVSKSRTVSDLNRVDGGDVESRRARRRGVTVHFPPTPMLVDGVESGWEVNGTRPLVGSASVPDRLGKGRGEGRDHSDLANGTVTQSTSESAGLRNGHAAGKEPKRSRLSDDVSSGQERTARVGRSKGKERVRDRDRNRNGFEGLFEEDDFRRPDNDNDPLKTLLASVDINNALRLISQTTLVPGGRQALIPGVNTRLDGSRPASSIGSVRSNPDRIPEVFVAKAPPSVTATLAQVGGSDDDRVPGADKLKPKDKLFGQGKERLSTKVGEGLKEDGPESDSKMFSSDGRIRMRSRRGTMIEREAIKREDDHPLSRIDTAQSDRHDQTLSSDDEIEHRASSSADHVGSIDDGDRRVEQPEASKSINETKATSQAYRPATAVVPPTTAFAFSTAPSAPTPVKKKRLSGLFHLKHSRSVSGGKWKKEFRGKDKAESDREIVSREVAEKDAAEHEAKVQSVLLSLPSHPRCEALAYQARSHFQAYYGLLGRSLEESLEKPGQAYLRWNPLRVIRWRKQVLAEEKRRQNWDASVNEQVRAHFRIISQSGQEPPLHESWNGMTDGPVDASPRASVRIASKVVSPPLRSATALSRALANDPQAALSMRRSGTFKEWLVLPSEILAFLDCRGHVDYFVPSTDKAQDSLRTAMATSPSGQIQGIPIVTPSRYARVQGSSPHKAGTSPGSYGTSLGNRSSVSFTSDPMETENHQINEGLRSRRSITKRIWATHSISRHHSHTSKDSEPGDRLVHVLKSPIDALKRHVLHHNSEGDTDHDQSGAEYPANQKHARLWKIASHNRHRGSMDTTASFTDDQTPDPLSRDEPNRNLAAYVDVTKVDGSTEVQSKIDQKTGTAHIEMASEQDEAIYRPEYEEIDTHLEEQRSLREDLVRNAGVLLSRVNTDLSPADGGFVDVFDTFKRSMIQVNQAGGLTIEAPVIPDALAVKGEANMQSPSTLSFIHSLQWGNNHSTKGHLMKRSGSVLPDVPETRDRRTVRDLGGHDSDPLTTLERTIRTLSERYDDALPKAVDLAQKQDDLQDQVSLMTTRAEQLRIKVDVEANGKIRRQRAHLQSLRIPKERSVDNWFYGLIKYLVNTALALIAAWYHIKRFFGSIFTAIWRIAITPFSIVMAIMSAFYRTLRTIYHNGAVRILLILAVWTFILVNFIL